MVLVPRADYIKILIESSLHIFRPILQYTARVRITSYSANIHNEPQKVGTIILLVNSKCVFIDSHITLIL